MLVTEENDLKKKEVELCSHEKTMQIRPTIVLTSLFYNVFKISFDYFDYLIILILPKGGERKCRKCLSIITSDTAP